MSTLGDLDHFVDLNEMVIHSLAAVEAGGSGRLNDGLEIAIIGVTENFGKSRQDQTCSQQVGAPDGLKENNFMTHGDTE